MRRPAGAKPVRRRVSPPALVVSLAPAAVTGSVRSPLLGNVSRHEVLALWFETEVKPRLRGKATLIRYCDDFIIGFEREDDARRVLAVLDKRLGRFGLTLHPDKTRRLSWM